MSEKNNQIQNAEESQSLEIAELWLKQPSLRDNFEDMFLDLHKKLEGSKEAEQHVGEKDKSSVKILPGVIRHTSRPHTPLAYYYSKNLDREGVVQRMFDN